MSAFDWLPTLLRRARLRGLSEGPVQVARAEALENDAKDDAERWQDYGFAANPVEGQGLVMNVAGHTIVVRMDRLAERPALAAYEVSIWHKEGHRITMKAGGVIEAQCATFKVTATTKVEIVSPLLTAQVVEVATSLKVAGKELAGHVHPLPSGGFTLPNA